MDIGYDMPCFHPIKGYKSIKKTENGKRAIVFSPRLGFVDQPLTIACGQCIGCRLEKSRQWAVRCVHEAQTHQDNCFITLTYDNDNLPSDHSLNLKDYQKFMKRLRKKYGNNIRFFHCGEYGDKYSRPHYHACIFGFDFKDKYLHKIHNEQKYYRSPSLEKLWPFGFSIIGNLTFESAAYVSRYVTKKLTGKDKENYNRVNVIDGEIFKVAPEYATMSRRPGIGKEWYDKYKNDVYPHDYVIINGKKIKPPKYYDRLYEIDDLQEYTQLKNKRELTGKEHSNNNTPERLEVRETIQKLKAKKLKRSYENENENL